MVDVEKIHALMSPGKAYFGTLFFIESELNMMVIPATSCVISLNEAQKRLLLCLKNKIERKQDIIRVVWDDPCLRSRDNNYHQLIFQLRKVFQKNGLPDNIILTIPCYGLRINNTVLQGHTTQGEDDESSSGKQGLGTTLLEKILTITRGPRFP